MARPKRRPLGLANQREPSHLLLVSQPCIQGDRSCARSCARANVCSNVSFFFLAPTLLCASVHSRIILSWSGVFQLSTASWHHTLSISPRSGPLALRPNAKENQGQAFEAFWTERQPFDSVQSVLSTEIHGSPTATRSGPRLARTSRCIRTQSITRCIPVRSQPSHTNTRSVIHLETSAAGPNPAKTDPLESRGRR